MHLRAILRECAGETAQFSNEAAKNLNRRGSRRRSLTLTAHTRSRATGELPVQILDISQGGLLLESRTTELCVDDHIEVDLPEGGPVRARVAWKSGPFVGCEFSQLVSPAAISAALLKADPRSSELRPAPDHRAAAHRRSGIEPQLNFSITFLLALVLWALIGVTVYITLN